MNISERIKKAALSSGLDLVGIAPADSFKEYRWKDSIMRDPTLSMADAKSLVIVGVSDLKKLKKPQYNELTGRVSRSYASGHEFNLVDELIPIKELLVNHGYQARISPGSIAQSIIPLKLAAVRVGMGWQGKNSVVITPEFGSWVTFGGLITNASLDYDMPFIEKNCGSCTACIDACPMRAIRSPYIVEMPSCLEEILNTPGNIPDDIKEKIGDRILSCETCLEVCPHNKKILKNIKFKGPNPFMFNLLTMLNLDKKEFKRMTDSLNWSIDIITFKRNVIIAIGNSNNRSVIHQLKRYIDHSNEILRSSVKWALNNFHKKESI